MALPLSVCGYTETYLQMMKKYTHSDSSSLSINWLVVLFQKLTENSEELQSWSIQSACFVQQTV